MIDSLVYFAAGIEGAAEAGAEALEKDLLTVLGVNTGGLIAQGVVFIILGTLLKLFVIDPILARMDERRQKIEESLDNAEKIKEFLADAEAQRKEIVAEAHGKATDIIEEAQKAAEAQSQKSLQEATAEAEGIIKRAHEATELDREKMMNELKAEIARLVVATTSKVADKVLTDADKKRLNEATLSELAASN